MSSDQLQPITDHLRAAQERSRGESKSPQTNLYRKDPTAETGRLIGSSSLPHAITSCRHPVTSHHSTFFASRPCQWLSRLLFRRTIAVVPLLNPLGPDAFQTSSEFVVASGRGAVCKSKHTFRGAYYEQRDIVLSL